MTNLHVSIVQAVTKQFPAIVPHLKGRSRWMLFSVAKPSESFKHSFYSDIRLFKTQALAAGLDEAKTYDYYLQNLERLIRSLYNGSIGREFLDIFANLISGQLTQAFEQAWKDEEGEGDLPDYLSSALEDMILGQYDHVDGLYNDIVNARTLEEPIEPLLARAPLWANQWNSAYREASQLIQMDGGGNFIWHKGETEFGCSTCAALDGIVMSAKEWQNLDVHPRGYPNPKLECQGGGPVNNCDCTLESTEQRRSPKAYTIVLDIVSR